jgi:hypothetical protein
MIPKNISREHVLAAIAEIDRDGVRNRRKEAKYRLLHQGKPYPPKYVVSLAAKYAIGQELPWDSFYGGAETNGFLEGLGFKIEPCNSESMVVEKLNWRERIVIDPAIHHGEPCIKGTRVPVSVIVGSIADGDTPEQIVDA